MLLGDWFIVIVLPPCYLKTLIRHTWLITALYFIYITVLLGLNMVN